MSGSISFVGTDDFKQVIHTFCNVARTDILYHTLNPSEKTIERRLQAIWARTWKDSFPDVETAKNFVSCRLQDIHLSVYIHYSNALDSADTLDKIKTLARSSFNTAGKATQTICKKPLPTHGVEVKNNLRTIWTNAQKTLQYLSLELAKLGIEEALKMTLVPQNIKNIYLEDVHLAQTTRSLESRIQSYLNDLEVKGQGITSTSLGSQGYPKIIDVQRGERILGFMKTLGSSLEMDYHLLYSFFLNDCLEKTLLPIQVPNASMFDIEKAQYTDPKGEKHDISKYNEQIKQLLTSIASLNTDAIKSNIDKELEFQSAIQTCPAGFFELVSGLNLADFFREKYLSLDAEQKDRFWSSLGAITYLDLVLGNRDRLIKLLPDMEGNYSFLDDSDENPMEESNLGNLMISHDFAQFYAIDNGIGDGQRNASLIAEENSSDEQAYTAFLEENLGKENFQTLAINYLIESLKKSIETAFQEADYNEDSLQDVLSDLSQEVHIDSLNLGMKRMASLLQTMILPKWNQSYPVSIKETLDKDFVQRIQTRLDLFERLTSSSLALQSDSDEEDELSQLEPLHNWSPLRTKSSDMRTTPFSPVMDRSKTKALQKIAHHLTELSFAIASQDTKGRVSKVLSALETEFLLPAKIQMVIARIHTSLSAFTPNNDNLSFQIKELADSLLYMDPSMISPRASRQLSWDDKDSFGTSPSFSAFHWPGSSL